MISATQLQRILGVGDNEIILYGYTLDRMTIELYFQDGKLIRVTTSGGREPQIERWMESKDARPDILFANVKRYYKNGTNPMLRALAATFREHGLPETDGGSEKYGNPCHYTKPDDEGDQD